jgi:hypothetical protein
MPSLLSIKKNWVTALKKTKDKNAVLQSRSNDHQLKSCLNETLYETLSTQLQSHLNKTCDGPLGRTKFDQDIVRPSQEHLVE